MGLLAVVGAVYPIERVACATQSDNLLGQCLCGRLAERLIGFESFDALGALGFEPAFRCRHQILGARRDLGEVPRLDQKFVEIDLGALGGDCLGCFRPDGRALSVDAFEQRRSGGLVDRLAVRGVIHV